MTFGRAVASVTASLAVAAGAVVALGMSRSNGSPPDPGSHAVALAGPTARPAFIPRTGAPTAARHTAARVRTPPAVPTQSVATSSDPTSPSATRSAPTTATAAPRTSPPASTYVAPPPAPTTHAVVSTSPAERAVSHAPAPRPTPAHSATHTAATRSVTSAGRSLPLGFSTGNATRVITVVARSHSSTTATLQPWSKVAGGWAKYGSAVTAHVGSDGLSRHASESRSATPIGSFTLTRAFGHDSDPGTSLPYVHTTPSDWWISQPGKLYNTLQVCSSHCSFNQGSPNEHLYYETPYYDYAVVIDYNTRNAPGGVHQGRGSAFFLHVSVGEPTAGCVSIPKARLISILRWLTPQSHARILIGVR